MHRSSAFRQVKEADSQSNHVLGTATLHGNTALSLAGGRELQLDFRDAGGRAMGRLMLSISAPSKTQTSRPEGASGATHKTPHPSQALGAAAVAQPVASAVPTGPAQRGTPVRPVPSPAPASPHPTGSPQSLPSPAFKGPSQAPPAGGGARRLEIGVMQVVLRAAPEGSLWAVLRAGDHCHSTRTQRPQAGGRVAWDETFPVPFSPNDPMVFEVHPVSRSCSPISELPFTHESTSPPPEGQLKVLGGKGAVK